MDEQMLKDLAKNLSIFCGRPPLIDPSKDGCDDNFILWDSYLQTWVKLWRLNRSQ